MTKMMTSNAKILKSIMDKMVITPSPSPHTCSTSYSVLQMNDCIQNGFIDGGIDFFAAGGDVLDSHCISSESFITLAMSAANDDNPQTCTNMPMTFWPKSKTAKGILRG